MLLPKVLLVFLILQILNDRSAIINCESNAGKIFIILHHLLQYYIMFGGYVSHTEVHLFVVVFSFAVHYLNDKLCPLTVIHNKMCGYERDRQLQTLLNRLEPDRTRVIYVYYTLLLVAVGFDAYVLYRKYVK